MSIKTRQGWRIETGENPLMTIKCDFCAKQPVPLEDAVGYVNLVGYNLHTCPECPLPEEGFDMRPVNYAHVRNE